jgi:2-polyprenyl-3-methyl-5-hydroxy-6-metoxy-1,4-benzoquinol methylase
VTCRACGKGARVLIREGVLPSRRAVYRCAGCGIDFFKDGVEEGYWQTPGQEEIYEDTDVAAERAEFFEDVLAKLSRLGARGSLLDIGAGKGEFAIAAVAQGWQVAVVEPSEKATQGLGRAGVKAVYNTNIEDFMPPQLYDAVTLLDVVEHTDDPLATIIKAAECLKPGGILVVLTPDGGSALRRAVVAAARAVPAFEWALKYQYYLPHLCYLNEKGLRMLARNAGLEVVSVERTATPRRFLMAKLRRHYAAYAGNGMLCTAVSLLYPAVSPYLRNKLLAFARKPL